MEDKMEDKKEDKMEDKKRYGFLIWGLVLMGVLIFSGVLKGEDRHVGYYRDQEIDSFEKVGGWELKFSRFRSNDWFNEDGEYTLEEEWIRWIGVLDGDKDLSRGNIIPEPVASFLEGEKTILSIRGAWDRRGENWVKVLPSEGRLFEGYNGDPAAFLANEENRMRRKAGESGKYIILPVGLESFSVYVWGQGYKYYIDAYVADYEGNQYVISGGDISHHGWKKINFRVPEYLKMKQMRRVYGIEDGNPIRFMDFTIRTVGGSRVKDFYTYIDYFHGKTDVRYFMEMDELRRHRFYWDKGVSVSKE